MANRRLKETVKNSRSFNKSEDANFGSGDMYRLNYEAPSNNIPLEVPPPAIPPRQNPMMDYPLSYCNPYNPYSSFNNSSYYNNYYPRNSYTYNNNFTQQAEVTTRRAFESVESVVQTLNSVAMMLDSSYQAVYNCFRALLGVSNNMSHLRNHMHNILKSASLIPFVRYALKNMRYLLLLLMRGKQAANEDFLWNESTLQAEPTGSIKAWPILMFFTVIAIGPWLLWKLMSMFSVPDDTTWIKNPKSQYVAKARFAFNARQSDELSFKRNDTVVIAPKELQKNKPKGWLLASDGVNKVGLVPVNHLAFMKATPSSHLTGTYDKESKISEAPSLKENKVKFQPVDSETMPNEKIDDLEKVFVEKT